MSKGIIIEVLQILVATSVFFVWFIRYKNIVEEFKSYGYPSWLRDLVGILKISCVVMINSEMGDVSKLGSAGLAILMLAAMVTHLRMKNPIGKILPSLTLFVFSIFLFFNG